MSNLNREFTREISPHQSPKEHMDTLPRDEKEGKKVESPKEKKLMMNESIFCMKGFRVVPCTE